MTNKSVKRKKKLSNGDRQILFVRWKDHCARTTGETWVDASERTKGAMECESVGFKVHEDKDILVLGISQDWNGKICDTMHIIKSCIIKRKIIA